MIRIEIGGPPSLSLTLPSWLASAASADFESRDVGERMRFVLDLARRSVEEGGGPFAAAAFEGDAGRLVAAGANLVVPGGSSLLHAEIVTLLVAQARMGRRTLGRAGSRHELVASCDPCAMCLGAVHWSGLTGLVTSASGADARRIGFDEGPVDDHSFDYLVGRGMSVRRGLLREEGVAVLEAYVSAGGPIYNG